MNGTHALPGVIFFRSPFCVSDLRRFLFNIVPFLQTRRKGPFVDFPGQRDKPSTRAYGSDRGLSAVHLDYIRRSEASVPKTDLCVCPFNYLNRIACALSGNASGGPVP